MFVALEDFADAQEAPARPAISILADLRKKFGAIDAANVLVIPPPPVRGIGTGGGFKMMVQDRANAGLHGARRRRRSR